MTLALLVFALVVGVFTYMKLPREDDSEPPSIGQVLLVTVLTVGTLGFGACGGWGAFAGLEGYLTGSQYEGGWAQLFLMAGLLGLLIALVLGVLAYRQWRPAKPKAPGQEG